MIADSPYRVDRLILPALVGAAAGAAAALVMLAVIRLAGEEALSRYLAAVRSTLSAPTGAPAAWGAHLVVGALAGLLYAVSQKSAPTRGLLAVGLFYGFLIWVVGGLLAAVFAGETLRAAVRTWGYLAACLGYGVTLAMTAMIWQWWRPAAAGAGPRD